MTNSFRPGDTKIHRYLIRLEDVADFDPNGLVHTVLSTFALGRELEWAARLFVLEMKSADEEGIGTELFIQHRASAFMGETLTATATFEVLDGANLRCTVEAHVGARLMATGHTGQRIVASARLAARFAALQAPAASEIPEPNQ